ncbi:hypothetical protein N9K47_00100 [bacterium]|nr:hypothetical protein [bacterium]
MLTTSATASLSAAAADTVEWPSLSGGAIINHTIATSTSTTTGTVTTTVSAVTVTANASSRRLAVVLIVCWLRLRVHRSSSSWVRGSRSLAHPALDPAERGHRAEQQNVLLLERCLGRQLQLRLAQLLRHRLQR